MANRLKNIETGEVYERIDRNFNVFANVDDPREMFEPVAAEMVGNELVRIDRCGNRYVKA